MRFFCLSGLVVSMALVVACGDGANENSDSWQFNDGTVRVHATYWPPIAVAIPGRENVYMTSVNPRELALVKKVNGEDLFIGRRVIYHMTGEMHSVQYFSAHGRPIGQWSVYSQQGELMVTLLWDGESVEIQSRGSDGEIMTSWTVGVDEIPLGMLP